MVSSFTASRSWGTNTNDSIPARAAWAATEFARLPVEAQAAILKPELAGLGEGDGDDAVFERACRVAGVVLHPELAQSELGCEPVGADEGREAGAEIDRGVDRDREEVGVTPHVRRTGGDPFAGDRPAEALQVVRDLQRPETELADMKRLCLVGAAALPTAKPKDVAHRILLIGRALAPGTPRGVDAGCRGCRQARSLGRSG